MSHLLPTFMLRLHELLLLLADRRQLRACKLQIQAQLPTIATVKTGDNLHENNACTGSVIDSPYTKAMVNIFLRLSRAYSPYHYSVS